MNNANYIFKDLLRAYANDDDIRTIVDSIQGNVSLLKKKKQYLKIHFILVPLLWYYIS